MPSPSGSCLLFCHKSTWPICGNFNLGLNTVFWNQVAMHRWVRVSVCLSQTNHLMSVLSVIRSIPGSSGDSVSSQVGRVWPE